MKTSVKMLSALVLSCSALGASVHAAALESQLEQFKVSLDDKGQEVFMKAEETEPNDIIEYRMQYKNISDFGIPGLKIIGPIPSGTSYIGGSAQTMQKADLRVSIDHGKNWEREPVKRQRTKPDGTVEEYVVPASQYTNVAWFMQAELSSKASTDFKYRVKIKK